MSAHSLFPLEGKWSGTCRTWFEPEILADESAVEGEFELVFDGRFVRHNYRSTIQGKPRRGEDLLAWNSVTEKYQSAWIDDFHMNYAILLSEGSPIHQGFQVLGYYDVGKGQPAWGWRTEFRHVDGDHLVITAYNIAPTGEEAKAVETVYSRELQ